MSLPATAQAIQAALLADAEALADADAFRDPIRALAGAVARRLAEIEPGQAEIFATRAALHELLFVAEKTWPNGADELWDRHFRAVDAARLRLGLSPLATGPRP